MPKEYLKIDFDSVEAGELASDALRNKKCLRNIYIETYSLMMKLRRKYLTNGITLEIGSGGGFIKDIFNEVITSDIKQLSNIDKVIDAEKLPFENSTLSSILAVHVIHHIPDITKFLKEASRVLKPGGGIICVEPYWGPLATFIYKKMHPEPFDKETPKWELDKRNPMTESNQAISYLILKRDREKFRTIFPEFQIVYRKRFGFLRYMMTGGLWLNQKLPDFMFPILKYIEIMLTPLMPLLAIHHIFVIKKIK